MLQLLLLLLLMLLLMLLLLPKAGASRTTCSGVLSSATPAP
jgi:hypothetical protein